LLSSHILAEVEALCDRVSIIRRGRTVESGTLADLRHLTRTSISAELAQPPTGLAALPGVHGLTVEGNRGHCQGASDQLAPVLRQLAQAGVRSLVSQPPTLEELFLRHYSDDLAGADGADSGSERWPEDGGRARGEIVDRDARPPSGGPGTGRGR